MDMCCGPWQELPGKGGDYPITDFVWFQLGPPIFLGMDGTWSVFDPPYLTGQKHGNGSSRILWASLLPGRLHRTPILHHVFLIF